MRTSPYAPPIPPPPRSQTLFWNALGLRNSVSLPGGNGVSRTLAFPNRYPFSASGARSIQLAAASSKSCHIRALKARFPSASAQGLSPSNGKAPDASRRVSSWICSAMNRAFSARDLRCINSWGVAPGWIEHAPLALNMCPNRVLERGISCRASVSDAREPAAFHRNALQQGTP
jgi:hypothetical protein